VSKESFKTMLFLPSQAAAETEATITRWHVKQGDSFKKGQILAEVESAKSTFEFEAPCDGVVVQLLVAENKSAAYDAAVIEIETSDNSLKNEIPSAAAAVSVLETPQMNTAILEKQKDEPQIRTISMLGIGCYLPERIVPNSELLVEHQDINEEYIIGVTGIKERRWAKQGEKPSDMAYFASKQAIEKSGLQVSDIDAIIVSTTTPDAVMPSTACILQEKLGIRGIPALDLNAACSGWLYGISVARGLILSGIADNVLVVATEMQSRVLDKKDRNTVFLFGDGAGATIISGVKPGHKILHELLTADAAGIHMARRSLPGYEIPANSMDFDPFIRLDGKALFRFATESFSSVVRELAKKSGWEPEDVRWVVPHQANGRIIKAAAQKSGVPFERFYLNLDRVGNTSSASIPIALADIERGIQKKDRIIFCTVGAGITVAGLSVEW